MNQMDFIQSIYLEWSRMILHGLIIHAQMMVADLHL